MNNDRENKSLCLDSKQMLNNTACSHSQATSCHTSSLMFLPYLT